MNNHFLLTQKAERDLEGIADYIGERNPKAADKLLEEFEQVFQLLVNSPKIGNSRPDLTKRQLRFWPVDSYLVIYKEASVLEIVRILSGYRNLFKIL